MALTPGTRLGVYEITAAIGEGGMGQVFRARDSRLDRDVAIKILPEVFAHDADRVARFTREAKTLASLNHPHIAGIYGLEESASTGAGQAGITALVMELVEGEDLSQRIARGPIPFDEALPIARQIAEALEAAHEQGIVHRDLKPANIKVRPDGTVKVLDFGLAKAMDRAGESGGSGRTGRTPDLSAAPTITSPATLPFGYGSGHPEHGRGVTGVGVLLGTAAYMAPEQAKGKAADKRSDIWAFGCVLYEMLTGRRAFPGAGVADTLAAVLRGEPDWSALPDDAAPTVRRVLERCLRKDARERQRDIGDVLLDLRDRDSAVRQPSAASARRIYPMATAFVVVALLGMAAGWVGARSARPLPVNAPVLRFQIEPPDGLHFASSSYPAVSADGSRIAFVAVDGAGKSTLWARSLDGATAQAVAGTLGATQPFWSPDGSHIGFFADGKLKKVALDGSAPIVLCDAPAPRGATWGPGDVIVAALQNRGPLYRVSASGGTPSVLTTLGEDGRELAHIWPQFAGDSALLYQVRRNPGPSRLAARTLDGSRSRTFDLVGPAVYTSGWLAYTREGLHVARRFDVESLDLQGEEVRLPEEPGTLTGGGSLASMMSSGVSPAGTLAFTMSIQSVSVIEQVDRSGIVQRSFGEAFGYAHPRGSPDGTRLLIGLREPGRAVRGDLWLLDVRRGTRVRFAPSGEDAVWSPDGERIVYSYNGGAGADQLLIRGVTDSAKALPLNVDGVASGFARPIDWSRNGRHITYLTRTPNTAFDSWLYDLESNSSRVLLNGAANEENARLSPDGRWLLYQSDETGRYEVYVQPFQAQGAKYAISTDGGVAPRWGRSGREIYFVAPDGMLMVVSIEARDKLAASAPVPLFQSEMLQAGAGPIDPSSDGESFFIQRERVSPIERLNVVINWPATLPR